MKKWIAGIALATVAVGFVAQAQDAGPFAMEIKARQGLMAYRAINIGTLAGMAKGEVPYDAAAAKTAADALLATATFDMSMLWPAGSDNSANPKSTAAAAIWADGSTIGDESVKFKTAAEAMAGAAGTDLAALQGAMDGLGGACGSCHKAFRVPSN